MIICKTVDDIRKTLWDITGTYANKRGKHGIAARCDLAGITRTILYNFIAGKHDTRIGNLVNILEQFGYRLAIVKAGDDNESKNPR